MFPHPRLFRFFLLAGLITLGAAPLAAEQDKPRQITLRAWGVPNTTSINIDSKAIRCILLAYQKRLPNVTPQPTTGLALAGGVGNMDIIPLMQIAGDIAPDVLYVNFRQSDTYISNKFLYPLDHYIEKTAAGKKDIQYIPGSQLMSLDEYLAHLRRLPNYQREIGNRVPRQCWEVMRRPCPYGTECPYCRRWGIKPTAHHQHIWCFPEGPLVMALSYRRDLFAEAGLPDHIPQDWDQFLDWARRLTDPPEKRYGLYVDLAELSWSTLSFLYSTGARIVKQDPDGNWFCVFDSEEAVEAYYFVARLFREPFANKYGTFNSVVYGGDPQVRNLMQIAMEFVYLDDRFFGERDVNQYSFGPVPKGPTGIRASEFNSRMTGIYAGLADDPEKRDAAWEYIRFYDGPEARLIRTNVFVEEGYGQFVQPNLLRAAGYPEYARLVPPGWEETFKEALAGGVPEPYGKNCQLIYKYVNKAVNQICTDDTVKDLISRGSDLKLSRAVKAGRITPARATQLKQQYARAAKDRIRQILRERVEMTNKKMLDILPPQEKKKRSYVAGAVVLLVFIIFVVVFRQVLNIFAAQVEAVPGRKRGRWEFFRYKWAYILMIPAVGSIALWMYYPLARGSIMAFQDYNVRGFSRWVGMQNWASVLYDREFWFAIWVTVKYGLMFMCFGFAAPIVLAFLLTEVPRGKVLFRTIYYLPAVLTGVVVMFLWKGFYGEYGMVNDVINFFIGLLNHLPGVALAEVHTRWLESPRFALFFCLLPTIWAGMGPGCLIYLAALKTVPDDLYEAADVDGAGIFHKVRYIALPGIKGLIMINFIGVMVSIMQSGGAMMLAMTGGGPYNPYGQTEVAGLHIFWEAFGYLRFGTAVSMAWILGSLLIGFTVVQIQKLSKMEFKTARGV